MADKDGRTSARVLLFVALMTLPVVLFGCSGGGGEVPPAEPAPDEPREVSIPLVTLQHWKDSTPGERYSFLIGFVTMLELEKEWQGQNGRELLPFDQSLVGAWVRGFENRPLAEIYNGLNRYVADKPGELNRPAAEVMWFLFAQPRMPVDGPDQDGSSLPGPDSPTGSN